MSIKTAFSSSIDTGNAVSEIEKQFGTINPKIILFFASSVYPPDEISKKVQDAFPQSKTIGCSTAGEIISGKMLKNSIVAMAFDSDTIDDFEFLVLSKIKEGNLIKQNFEPFEKHFNKPVMELSPKEFVGIILIDGLSGAEEKLMGKISGFSDINFIGGSAGNDLKFKTTYVFAGGKAYTDAAVIAVLKPRVKFDFIKTQSFNELAKKLTATKVNEASREVLEFDGKPAIQAYAEAVGTSISEASNQFMHNPVGLMVDTEPYIRSPQQAKDKSIVFYCNIKEGMELSVMESTDIVKDTQIAVDSKVKEMGGISGIINFHCILRTLELEQKKQTEPYGKIFTQIPTIGFSTYGEEFIGHINQTSTMLVFK